MAGTDTDMRRLAQYKLKDAIKNGAPAQTIGSLRADFEMWNNREDSAMGKNGR